MKDEGNSRFEAEQVVSKELAPGERLVWAGRPRRGFRLTALDAFLIPFSLAWCGFVVYFERAALRSGSAAMVIFGLPFVAVGLFLLVGRFVLDALRRAKTFYGVTNQRALIVSGMFGKCVQSFGARTLGQLSFSERKDGS